MMITHLREIVLCDNLTYATRESALADLEQKLQSQAIPVWHIDNRAELAMIAKTDKIKAIKMLREQIKCGLWEAKVLVEAIMAANIYL